MIVQPLIVLLLITTAINIIYWVVLTGKFGATLGKMAMGIKVVKDDLQPITYAGALVRELLVKDFLYPVILFVSWLGSLWILWTYKNPLALLLSFFVFLGYLWVMWDRRKQGWHDKIAKTVVIREIKSRHENGGQAAKPVIPAVPTEPVVTITPVKPIEPVIPTKPIEPVVSVEPAIPSEPAPNHSLSSGSGQAEKVEPAHPDDHRDEVSPAQGGRIEPVKPAPSINLLEEKPVRAGEEVKPRHENGGQAAEPPAQAKPAEPPKQTGPTKKVVSFGD
jgi:uncharacterized RDD family membrane protein YckC